MAGEPLGEVFAQIEAALEREGRAALCQIVRTEGSTPGKPGWKLLVRADGTACGNLGGGAFEAMAQSDARAKLAERRPQTEVKRYYLTERATRGEATGMVCGGMADVLLEVLTAKPLLAICGGGPVAQALAANAALCGLEIMVAEDREAFRRPELFPDGTRFAAVDREYGEDFLAGVIEREILVAVVSRCWETDLAAATAVLRQAPPRLSYLGLMGSRRKVERIRSELADRGFELDGVPLFAPIGLPIGGDQPSEIAVSILAEMIQVRSAAAAAARPKPRAVGEGAAG